MFSYQLKLLISEHKIDEFMDSLGYLSGGIREEQGCLDFSLYRDLQNKDVYRVIGEWKTRRAMEAHFKRNNFGVLIGAARVLGEDFKISTGETLEKGSYSFVQEKIPLHRRKDKMLDLHRKPS